MVESYPLQTEYITLGQFLKDIAEIGSGGEAKWYLQENTVYVDQELEDRRGRKLYAGMTVELPGERTYHIVEA